MRAQNQLSFCRLAKFGFVHKKKLSKFFSGSGLRRRWSTVGNGSQRYKVVASRERKKIVASLKTAKKIIVAMKAT